MSRFAAALGLYLLWCGPASADIVHLVTGTSQECVIRKVTDEWITYETEMGVASLPRRKVAAITRDPAETNDTLVRGWRAARAADQARRRARARQNEVDRLTKRALGFVEYEGEWITPEERAARKAAKRAAEKAGAALNRRERDAGHLFYYGVWMTRATYEAVLAEEEQLSAQRDRFVGLQQEISLLGEQIDTARMMAVKDSDLDSMEERAEQIARLRETRNAAEAEIRELRERGDARAARIRQYVARTRERLATGLAKRGEPAAALEYLADIST